MPLEAGMNVRLRGNPGRIGTLSNRTRTRNDHLMWLVMFQDGSSNWHPDYEIEPAEALSLDPHVLLSEGRYGRIGDLRRRMSHIQLSGRLANVVYSMEITNTDFYAYQFKPVIAMLESPSNGLLVADEVGLGKTIEAGLVWTEIRSRFESRRLLVVCPAMLREKWRDELRLRFGIEARIVDAAELLYELKTARTDLADGRALIGSIQGLRPTRDWEDAEDQGGARAELARFLADRSEDEYLIDMLVVDEAHYLRNPETRTFKLGQMLRDVSEHNLLLSATPINLGSDDLFNLLRLVDPETFQTKETFPEILSANEPLLRARAMSLDMTCEKDSVLGELRAAQQHSFLRNNRQLADVIEKQLTLADFTTRAGRISIANRIEQINLLKNVVIRTRKRDVHENRVIRRPHPEYVPMTAVEEQFYSAVTEAVRLYAASTTVSDRFLLASPQRQMSSCMAAAAIAWKTRLTEYQEQIYEDIGQEVDAEWDISPLIDHVARQLGKSLDPDALAAADSKYDRFVTVIREYLQTSPSEKIIVFAFFRGTLEYLERRLKTDGIGTIRLVGGMAESKQEIINRFSSDSNSVLLSSEVASEGVDLQFSRLLINYDLPWNPMKVEQRIGRIDRIGQSAPAINIWNLMYADTIDQRIYVRLFDRLKIFEAALGSMDAILGEETRALTIDLLSTNLSPDEETERIDQTAHALEQKKQEMEVLEAEASHLIAHGGYILEKVNAAHSLAQRITDEDLVLYVKDYLTGLYQGATFSQKVPGGTSFDIRLPTDMLPRFRDFLQKMKLSGKTRLATGEAVVCEFTNKIAGTSGSKERINQLHPLIRFIGEDMKSRGEKFYPLVAGSLDSAALSVPLAVGDYVFKVSLWYFHGLRTEERVEAAAVSLESGALLDSDLALTLVRAAKLHGQEFIAAPSELEAAKVARLFDSCELSLEGRRKEASANWDLQNHDKVELQMEATRRRFARQISQKRVVLEKLEARKRTRQIPAMRRQIENMETKCAAKLAELSGDLVTDSYDSDVCYGVIRVQ